MRTVARTTASFPSAHIPSPKGGLPVEVTLVAQLGHGAGDRLCRESAARQRLHGRFADALDEPAATLASTDIDRGETTALHSFLVGPQGHPFHRHAGHRVFTAVSGSGGAQLRFCMVPDENLTESPDAFIEGLRYIDIPPDSLFTVRFGGGTWHQFAPLREGSSHPTLFALSCHTNELGGLEEPTLLEQVNEGTATIHSLTQVLPASVRERLGALSPSDVPTITLSLHASPDGMLHTLCGLVRRMAGHVRAISANWQCQLRGFVGHRGSAVRELPAMPQDSLLRSQLSELCEHEDTFELVLHGYRSSGHLATTLLADVLEGFLVNRPTGVSGLMRLRNVLVRPLGLRTSPLGCPASSLLSTNRDHLFAGRYPVLQQSIDPRGQRAEVILGADDGHLRFRTCVGVRFVGEDARVTLGTRVQCRNGFGRTYMALIGQVHRSYVSPTMLAMAVEHAHRRVRAVEGSTVVAF